MKAGPFKTKKDAVEAGLKLLARQAAYREILKWEGKLHWDGDDRIAGPRRPLVAASRSRPARRVALPSRRRPQPRSRAVVVVDSGVWIDFFNGTETPGRAMLRRLLRRARRR